MKRRKVSLGIKVMQRGHNWKFPPKVFYSFFPEEMNNIKAVWKLAEAFDGFSNGKLRASDGFYPRIVFVIWLAKFPITQYCESTTTRTQRGRITVFIDLIAVLFVKGMTGA